MSSIAEKKYDTFAEYYPAYLAEHANRACRELHFAGSTLSILCLAALLLTGHPLWLLAALAASYGFAWVGHIMFEKDAGVTFRQPLYSFMGDWVMYWQMLTGQASF
jgi:hypothetical protein